MGAFILISGAIAFLAAAVFMRLRWVFVLALTAANFYFLTPDNFFIDILAPRPKPAANGNIIIAAAPPTALWLFYSCIGLFITTAIARGLIQLSGYTRQKLSHKPVIGGVAQSLQALLSAGFGFAASMIFCSFFGPMITRAEWNAFPAWPAYIGFGLLTAFSFIHAAKNLKKDNRNIAAAAFSGISALVLAGHFSIALLTHAAVLLQAETLARGKPYCLVMPTTEKTPPAFAFADWPNFLMGSSCNIGGRAASAVMHLDNGTGAPSVIELYTNKSAEYMSSIKAVSCTPERFSSLRLFPKRAPETLRVHTPEGIYTFPASMAEVTWRNLTPERSFRYEPTVSIETPQRDFHLSRPVSDAETEFAVRSRPLFMLRDAQEASPQQTMPAARKPDIENPVIKCNNVFSRGKKCRMRFYEAPFDYHIELDENEQETAQEIGRSIIQRVQSARTNP